MYIFANECNSKFENDNYYFEVFIFSLRMEYKYIKNAEKLVIQKRRNIQINFFPFDLKSIQFDSEWYPDSKRSSIAERQ